MSETPASAVVTALDADIIGSTALGERFDPEDVQDIMGPAIALMIQRIEAAGGVVKDLAGDGLLALFGVDGSDPDHTTSAIRTGLAIGEAIREYAAGVERDWSLSGFGVRVGIEAGQVAIGAIGAGSRVEMGVTGDALVLAAKLQAHASPFGVIVGPAAHAAAAERFRWEEGRDLQISGRDQPVPAWPAAGEV